MGCSLAAFAQKDFRPGYIITLEGDTLRGQIRDRSDARNSRSVIFKQGQEALVKEYEPAEVMGFGIEDQKLFLPERVPIIKVTPVGSDTTWQVVFLQQLVTGPISLFYLKTAGEPDRFFLRRANGRFSELESRKQIVEVNGKHYQKTLNFYQDTLRAIFAACPQVAEQAAKAEFTLGQLSKAFVAYNQCADPKEQVTVSETATRKTVVLGSATLGYAIGSTRSSGEQTLLNSPTGKKGPSGGVAINILNTGFSKNFSLQFGLDYTNKGAVGHHYTYSNSTTPTTTTIDMQVVNFSTIIRFNTAIGKLKHYIGAGPTAGYVLNYNDAYQYGNHVGVFPNTKAEYGLASEAAILFPLKANQGVALSLRYERTRISFNFTNRGEYYNHYFRLGVGYWFSSRQ